MEKTEYLRAVMKIDGETTTQRKDREKTEAKRKMVTNWKQKSGRKVMKTC